MKLFKITKPIIIKSSGGVTAQLLALTNALYLSSKFQRQFKIVHNDSSTGTFRPFEIMPLLQLNEYELIEKQGNKLTFNPQNAELLDLSSNRKILLIKKIRELKFLGALVKLLDLFRGNYIVRANRKNLLRVNARVRFISGNFVPYLDSSVAQGLKIRFRRASLPSPINDETDTNKGKWQSDQIIIHVRLGDMRKMNSRIPGIGGHGIIDPSCYLDILSKFQAQIKTANIRVVSDEPELALKLLSSVGINAKMLSNFSVWEDIESISKSTVFIGSMSQFSFFGALVCDFNGGIVFLPLNLPDKLFDTRDNFGIKSFNYYSEKYLPADHWIFQKKFFD